MHIVTNFDAKTWIGIIGIGLLLIIFLKGMGTKEGGAGDSGNGNGKSNRNSSGSNVSNTSSTTNNSNNNGLN